MSSVLNVSNEGSRPEGFSIKDIEMLVDNKEQNWFQRAHVGTFLGIEDIRASLNDLEKCELIVNSKDKGKVLKDHILKDIVPRGLDAGIEEIQKKHQQAIEDRDTTLSLLDDDLKNREYENVGLQGELKAKDQQIAALQRRYVGYLSDEDKNNGISIIAKNNDEAEYPDISICGQHGYRRHKARVMLSLNKVSTLFADGDTLNAIVTYNFLR